MGRWFGLTESELATALPMHSSGVRSYELYKWNVNEGVTNITLKFSDQSFVIE